MREMITDQTILRQRLSSLAQSLGSDHEAFTDTQRLRNLAATNQMDETDIEVADDLLAEFGY